ncbi:MAG: response regulator transcription factor [Elusimicrobia bacterium]|nr:response regulator transcription factor [Elusimicrobiota bacterium]MDE2237589.1 response regulator transcription factor [Elusimicrobiota bacterium]MDE2425913.1 response regulator transcription factor [Elusimicrobiota bacterium]
MPKAQILVVEDQAATASLIADVLGEEGYEAKVVGTMAEARADLSRALPDLIVLDRNLPDGDGLDLCRELREERRAATALLILTAKKAVEERVYGLKGGADDYLTKPFNTEELLARIEALLRRGGKAEEPEVQEVGIVRLDGSSRKAYVKGKEAALSGKEFDLLWYLAYRKNRVLTRDFLLQHVWGYEAGLDLTTKVVDVTVSHLRDKLGPAAGMIVAVRGFGYRLDC